MGRHSDALFGALFALEEVREILRQTAPGHELDEAQKKKMASALAEVKKHLSVLEELA
jgi:hypothetical protein